MKNWNIISHSVLLVCVNFVFRRDVNVARSRSRASASYLTQQVEIGYIRQNTINLHLEQLELVNAETFVARKAILIFDTVVRAFGNEIFTCGVKAIAIREM